MREDQLKKKKATKDNTIQRKDNEEAKFFHKHYL